MRTLPLLLAAACAAPPADLAIRGPHAVGHVRGEVAAGARTLPVELWYPALPGDALDTVVDFERGRPEAEVLAPLVDAAPDACVPRRTGAVREAAPAPGPWPVVVASHCHECVRWSLFPIAERLASHGFVVAAPDHVGNTLYDALAGGDDLLGGAFLATRGDDVATVLDAVLAGDLGPEGLSVDAEAVGVVGHSFGAATAGRVLQEDDRFRAGLAIAAPIESPLLPGVSTDAVDEPIAFLLAREDNSITELGNQLLRANHEAVPGPSWLVEVADAGHWSFTAVPGLVEAFQPGCGEGTRQTDGTPFTYVAPDAAREVAATVAARFFAGHLRGDAEALAALGEADALGVTVDAR